MYRPRLIPVLLLDKNGLYKSQQFKNHEYVGDPINAVKIFNDARIDELVVLDIHATKEGRCIDLEWVKKIAEEADMPLAIGGGITSVEQMKAMIEWGVEKVVLGTLPIVNPSEVRKAVEVLGSSSVVVCVDVKKNTHGEWEGFYKNGQISIGKEILSYLLELQEMGVGEIIIQDIDADGRQCGYDIKLFSALSQQLSVPVVACGGAKSVQDMIELYKKTNVSAMAAGSLFVHKGKWRAVLINYPDEVIKSSFLSAE
jgi:cyclase